MDWFKLAILVIQVIDRIADIVRERGQMNAGRDAALAEVAASILSKTQIGKQIDLRAAGLSEAQVDKELKDLEPK